MEMLHNKYGESQFTFYDDAFTINRNHTIAMCQDILDRKLKVEWDCETRVDAVDKELLEIMRRAGCIPFGLASNPAQLKFLRRCIKKSIANRSEKPSKWHRRQA
jgi:radical SAM superfamily enzyme YgiQ (UPF0313 family)